MKKLESIIRPECLQAVQDALDELGASGLNVTEIKGCGSQKGYTEAYRGAEARISLLPKIKVETVIADEIVEQAIEAIVTAAHTGETGDGLIFVAPIDSAVRIRTGEGGEQVVSHTKPEHWGR